MITAEELKLITAANIINLRRKAGMTQVELGSKINYSDKTVSKWERGEAVPDAWVLMQLAEIFGVDVDYFLASHDGWEYPEKEEEKLPDLLFSYDILVAVVILAIMTLALTAFIIYWMLGELKWFIFLIGVAASSVAYMVLDIVFRRARNLRIALTVLIVSLFSLSYLIFIQHNFWQLFILMIPAVAIAILATYISTNSRVEK